MILRRASSLDKVQSYTFFSPYLDDLAKVMPNGISRFDLCHADFVEALEAVFRRSVPVQP